MSTGIDYSKLPEYMQEGIRAYIETGRQPGDFLYLVLCNDLVGAFGQADEANSNRMRDWAAFLFNEAPSPCWGDAELVEAWIARCGLQGPGEERVQSSQEGAIRRLE